MLEYVEMLFEEGQYILAGKTWQKIEYENLKNTTASRLAKNIDYLKIVLKLKDEIITKFEEEINTSRSISD